MNSAKEDKSGIEILRAALKKLDTKENRKTKAFYEQLVWELISLQTALSENLDASDELNLLSSEEEEKKYAASLRAKFEEMSKKELLDKLVTTSVNAKLSSISAQFYGRQFKFYEEKYLEGLKNKIQTHKSRVAGKAAVYKSNNDCMDACFQALSKRLKRPLDERDFPEFRFLVLEKFPTRPFAQKTRTKKEIKKLSPERQREAENEAKNDSWPDSTLYKFFYKKISTVK